MYGSSAYATSTYASDSGLPEVVLFEVAKASSTISGNSVSILAQGTANFPISNGSISFVANSVVLNPNGTVSFSISKSSATATANTIDYEVFWQIARATANLIGKSVEITGSGTILFAISKAQITAQAIIVDFVFPPIDGIPDLILSRSADFLSAEIILENPDSKKVKLLRADDHIATFQEVVTTDDINFPYTDSGLDKQKNYKYRATFILEATKGGSPYIVEGKPSDIRIIHGKNKIL